MKTKGSAHKYGDNVDTDAIIPARLLHIQQEECWARHCMTGIDPEFPTRVKPGDFIVAMENFGCGSSREQAPRAIKATKVGGVIAASFARIFFRNAINLGLSVLVSPEAAAGTELGDELEVDFSRGEIANLSKKKIFKAAPYPEFIMAIVRAGGLIPYLREALSGAQREKGKRNTWPHRSYRVL